MSRAQSELPRKFIRSYGDDIPKVIHLTTPTGKEWKFNLVRENGKAFLQNGWQEFAKFYSLSQDHFLVFKYQQNSHFDVVICDASFSEIDYPLGSQACKKSQPSQKRKALDLTKSTTSKKAKRVQSVMDYDQVIISHSVRHGALTPEETKRIREFVRRYCRFLFKKQWTFNLQTDTNEHNWPIKTICSCRIVKFSSGGWKNFVSGNKLKVGDFSIFELINKQEIKVHILRVANVDENHQNSSVKVEV
ncbi:hypothetical protein RDABS01_004468 [Bienertia sinuspersici]